MLRGKAVGENVARYHAAQRAGNGYFQKEVHYYKIMEHNGDKEIELAAVKVAVGLQLQRAGKGVRTNAVESMRDL